ncbi:hypothetical protein ASG89_33600 [Paenibacillus sp. Soil766]|uniref:hypothetical protein n=1 Tax=Paenibacillus sp. Soil766 TaxID=1736404 RepID=UPI000710F5B4|nr:hypothetical protein [Paenibacillus sp. Soil766]KRE92187.1 hypothetical protein ASG89_33600 [Paenibacillus sp. Soil766]
MKITIYDDKNHTLVYLYFYAREDCIRLNSGGESDKNCNLLFDDENEWIGLSIESDYKIQDLINQGNSIITRTNKTWHVLFDKNVKIVREELHGCITDLHNNNYTGIELILLKGAVPNRKYAIGLL